VIGCTVVGSSVVAGVLVARCGRARVVRRGGLGVRAAMSGRVLGCGCHAVGRVDGRPSAAGRHTRGYYRGDDGSEHSDPQRQARGTA